MLNPYAAQLGGRNARGVIGETAGKLRAMVERLSPSGLERSYEAGKWTARQILCHLADCEIAFGFRLRQAMAETDHVIQPFDQSAWGEVYQKAAYSAEMAAEVFAAVRGWNLAFFDALSGEALAKPVTHPERGAMTISTILETMGGHDLNHLQQLQTIAAAPAA